MKKQRAEIRFEDVNGDEKILIIEGRYIPASRETREHPGEPADYEILKCHVYDGSKLSEKKLEELLFSHSDDIFEQLESDYASRNPTPAEIRAHRAYVERQEKGL